MQQVAIVCGADEISVQDIAFLQELAQHGFQIQVVQCPKVHVTLDTLPHLYQDTPYSFTANVALVLVLSTSANSPWSESCHTLVRTAALNFETVAVVVQAQDYPRVQNRLTKDKSVLGLSLHEKQSLAEKAFRLLSDMDAAYANRLASSLAPAQAVLLIGAGGREHALAWKLAQSPRVSHVYVAPGNGGTANKGKISNVAIGVDQHDALLQFAKANHIALCVVGPEAPLIDGLVDKMGKEGISAFGPSAQAAVLEGSKAYSKDFMQRHGIRTARYRNFSEYSLAKSYLDTLDYAVVIKASGIAAGKGVVLPATKEEAHACLVDIMLNKAFGTAGDEVVIEECIQGEEVSVLAFSDGKSVIPMPGAQDHKRIRDGDQGPNTGGMGAYVPAPCLTPELEAQTTIIIEKVIAAMAEEGKPYVGVLYAGFMLTADGPSVLEFNCRFGDPETQVLLPLLASDLFEIMLACVEHRLSPSHVQWKTGSAVTLVAASHGYPGSYSKNNVIAGIDEADSGISTKTFHAGTLLEKDELRTSGGRVLAVSAWAPTLETAVQRAYEGMEKISFTGAQYRRDIGLKGLLYGTKPIKLAILGSTRGTSLQPIIDAIERSELNASIEIVLSNKKDAGILARAKKHGIEATAISSKGVQRSAFDLQVSTVLDSKQVDLVLLIGYMRILSPAFCQKWEGRVLNVHPSLLPDFAGGMDLAVHQAVLDAKRTESGCTTHFITEIVDAGPIAVQMKCPVEHTDTAETLKARVQALEGQAFLHSIRLFQTGQLVAIAKAPGGITYADAGVSIDAGNLLVETIKPYCKSTIRPGCDSDLGGFGGLFDLTAAGYTKDTVLVACTDGVGTKLKVAQLVGQHDTVGIDLVAMCVNDLVVQGAEPLLFLDYYACGKLHVQEAADVVKGIAAGCRESNCGLIGGETAEMPSMYPSGEYDLAGFCIGAVNKSDILPLPIQSGDVLIGMASSGIHSNGYSLVRKLVELSGLDYSSVCPFEPTKSLGESLLTPTRIYVKQLMPILKLKLIQALAHITGGGLLENIPRVLPKHLAVEVDCTSWTLPPVFQWLRQVGALADEELARTFNCGVGMVLIVSAANRTEVLDRLATAGEDAFVMGSVIEKTNEEQVVLVASMS